MYHVVLRDKESSKIVAEAEYEITKKGVNVTVSFPFPRPSPLEIFYKLTVGPAIILASLVLLRR